MSSVRRRWKFFKNKRGEEVKEEITDEKDEIKPLGGPLFNDDEIRRAWEAGRQQQTPFSGAFAARDLQDQLLRQALSQQELYPDLRKGFEPLERERLLEVGAQLRSEIGRLRRQVASQQAHINQLQMQNQRSTHSLPSFSGSVVGDLLQLITEFHPDKNPSGLDATRVTAALTELRSRYSKKSPSGG